MSLYSKAAVFASFFVRRSSSPVGNENALVVRNIPSGIQAVSITSEQATGQVKSIFNEISSVPIGATVSILTYTVPPGKTNYLLRAEISGTNIATYTININGLPFSRKRTWFAGNFSEVFQIGSTLTDAFKLYEGDIIEIQVNNFRPSIADYESRIHLIET